MNYIHTFVEWFWSCSSSGDVNIVQLILTLGLTMINAMYLFGVYRILTRKTFYAKRYNITLSAVALITASIIFTVQTDVVLSLGVIGALAIVRFRTAIKDPLDIVFLFWAVVIGICCGAHMAEIAIMLSAILTILIFYLEGSSVRQGYGLLILECDKNVSKDDVQKELQRECKRFKIKKTDLECSKGIIVAEVVVKKELQLLQKLQEIAGVTSISLIAHEGEHNY